MRRPLRVRALTWCGLVWSLAAVASSTDAAVISGWSEGYNSQTRLMAGHIESSGQKKLYAFVEILMPKGWKTYWRNPGDAGGLPPTFKWDRSQNLSKAEVLFPAPLRMTDPAGDNIGYHDRVIFPVVIEASDPAKPITLALDMNFGICKDICVPSEAMLDLEIPGGDGPGSADADAAAFLARVPQPADAHRPDNPTFIKSGLDTSSGKAKLRLEARFPAGTTNADAFLEVPDGLYVPMFSRVSKDGDDIQIFETELGSLVEPADLKGKTLSVTLVSDSGQSVATFSLD